MAGSHTILPQDFTLATLLEKSFKENINNTAIKFHKEEYKYRDLLKIVDSIYLKIIKNSSSNEKRVAIFASRSITAYAGLIATILSGKSYVPLSRRLPPDRIMNVLEASNCRTIILGDECSDEFLLIAKNLTGVNIIIPESKELYKSLSDSCPHLIIECIEKNEKEVVKSLKEISPEDEAYLMFTSGTTGKPKGVPVQHKNIVSFLMNLYDCYDIGPKDCCSQVADLTFDASVQDIFLTLTSGATLCVIPEHALFAPASFIKSYKLTVWHSVPSVPMFMEKFGMLTTGAFPSLRYTFFGGEALTCRVVALWRQAAPNSTIENEYGPTEATVYASIYSIPFDFDGKEAKNAIVPIGVPFPNLGFSILDKNNNELDPGQPGELCISGQQVVKGYLNNETLTKSKFFINHHGLSYRTGDLAMQNDEGIYIYLGRIDDQIQLRGFRVELQEIDFAIRSGAETDLAVAVPIKLNCGVAESIYAAVQGNDDKKVKRKLLNHCKKVLPDYMVPAKVIFIESMPLNVNGKVDRKALAELFV